MSATTQAVVDPNAANKPPKESIKETLVSIIISFVLAFVCRGFVVEPFVIPTGSMAPTLMGAHMLMRADESGYTWPVGPWEMGNSPDGTPLAIQGANVNAPVVVNDPMTGEQVRSKAGGRPIRGGDRILVLKYLYAINSPHRFDVVVFKNPHNPQENYIKRLLGTGGEQIALVDGDVFTRDNDAFAPAPPDTANTWDLDGWKIARKPEGAQGAVWQPVFDSQYAPIGAGESESGAYTPPWVSTDRGWTISGPVYSYEGDGPTELKWDATRPRYREGSRIETWEIDDRTPYNQLPMGDQRTRSQWLSRFPVSDVRMRSGIEPVGSVGGDLRVTATIVAHRHEFVAEVSGGKGVIRRRGGAPGANMLAWEEIASGDAPAFAPGKVVDVEFSHVDQALELRVDGRLVCRAEYDWSPAERIEYSTGRTVDQLLTEEESMGRGVRHIFMDGSRYEPVQVRWGFRGAPVKLHRVALDRDLYYRAGVDNKGMIGRGTHPSNPVTLDDEEYWCLGDNSPSSLDGRFLDPPTDWVAKEMWRDRGKEPKDGVVPRDLLIGKAFFVYFPAMHTNGPVPMPDFGRLRFIR